MITLYHLGVSQSDRIVWLLEELSVPYRIEWFDRGEDGLAPPEFYALHPAATAPIIRDGDLLLPESAAIVEYLSQRYGGGSFSVAPEQRNYPDYLYWMQFNANIQSMFLSKQLMGDKPDTDNQLVKVVQRREKMYYDYLEQRLGQVDYLAGNDISCADIMAVFNFTTLTIFGGRSIDEMPNVKAYLKRIEDRPAYQKAMQVAGPGATRPD